MTATREFKLEVENEVLYGVLRETLEQIATALEIPIEHSEWHEPKRNFQLYGEIGERLAGEFWMYDHDRDRSDLSKKSRSRTRGQLRRQVNVAAKKVRDAHVNNAKIADQRDGARAVARRFRDGWIIAERADGTSAWRKDGRYPPLWDDITSDEFDAIVRL